MMRTLQGVRASEGIAIGPAFVHQAAELEFGCRPVGDLQAEWEGFQRAVQSSKNQLQTIHAQASREIGEDTARIIKAQVLILQDPTFLDEVRSSIEAGNNSEEAVWEVIESYARTLEAMKDEYFRARAGDVRDVGRRLLHNLLGLPLDTLAALPSPSIIVSHDLTPSDTAHMDRDNVLGFCTAMGGVTSHTAILAQALGLSAVVGLGAEIEGIKNGTLLILDGGQGLVIVEPDEKTLERYRKRSKELRRERELAMAQAHLPARTTDGYQVEVVANIGNVESARVALDYGAEGVGLLRTEFLFLERSHMPSEEEQYQAYRAVADAMENRPLIIRTLDVGGDKPLPYVEIGQELNPFLGWRAIRLSLSNRELFKTQLRAILRAGNGRNVKVMFPMIATAEEVRQAKLLLTEAASELKERDIPFASDMEVGIMIEIPSAAIGADLLAPEVDFFSIGTNDLIQYTMACDRTNEKVSYLYEPLHPVILRLVQNTIKIAHGMGKWVGMCGEMAGDRETIPILLGLGLDEFSMNPTAIPKAKCLILSLSLQEARDIAERAMAMDSVQEIRSYIRSLRLF